MINAAFLNVYFILQSIYFSVKKFIFSNVYISVNTIFGCLYMFFWLRKRPSIKYVRNCQLLGDGEVTQNTYSFVQGEGVSWLMCTYALTLTSLFMFWEAFCLIVYCFICRNLTLPLFKKDVFGRNGYFSPTRSISVVMK